MIRKIVIAVVIQYNIFSKILHITISYLLFYHLNLGLSHCQLFGSKFKLLYCNVIHYLSY